MNDPLLALKTMTSSTLDILSRCIPLQTILNLELADGTKYQNCLYVGHKKGEMLHIAPEGSSVGIAITISNINKITKGQMSKAPQTA